MSDSLGVIERKILMSGTDDWVHMPEAVGHAYRSMGGDVTDQEALPVAIAAVKNLVQAGLVEVGTIADVFVPWTGTPDQVMARIDEAAAQASFPIVFGDLFWISNTQAGTELGEKLLTE